MPISISGNMTSSGTEGTFRPIYWTRRTAPNLEARPPLPPLPPHSSQSCQQFWKCEQLLFSALKIIWETDWKHMRAVRPPLTHISRNIWYIWERHRQESIWTFMEVLEGRRLAKCHFLYTIKVLGPQIWPQKVRNFWQHQVCNKAA